MPVPVRATLDRDVAIRILPEAHFKAGVAFCDQTPIPVFQGTTREFYAAMLMRRNAGDDRILVGV